MKNALSKNKILSLFSVCCIALPASAFGSGLGEVYGDDWFSLFEEKVEQYGNSWSGKSVLKEAGQSDIYIKGEGKTVGFDGILSMNCENSSGHYWKTASIWEEPATKAQIEEIMPPQVVANARKWFCK